MKSQAAVAAAAGGFAVGFVVATLWRRRRKSEGAPVRESTIRLMTRVAL